MAVPAAAALIALSGFDGLGQSAAEFCDLNFAAGTAEHVDCVASGTLEQAQAYAARREATRKKRLALYASGIVLIVGFAYLAAAREP